MAIIAASTAAALVVHFGPKLARIAFSALDGKKAEDEFHKAGLHNQAGLIPFNGKNGGSTPTPGHSAS